ncbi:hypothetical protein AVEN_221226-1 [Araneus ventricosus]|uniref:RNase H type-1 domain-containing protein n=1 Tax=Araneus ventricosus TaxID=182803 RepID=A0A4Y2F660_ARAVE|nr:hypothetical protein AVEN_221226-1 [Araneus ventricosus]
MTIQDARISPWIMTMDSSPGPGARCPAIKKKDKPMDSKIQVNNASITGETGCKQPGKKRAKEKEFSVERLHILRWRRTNLNKLERVQLSAARIITGLRSCCPKATVLYEADLQPLSMKIRTNSAKYIAKLQSLGSFNRTSKFILQWTSNQRLKKDSPVGVMWKRGLLDFNIEPCILFSYLTPNTSLDRVSFSDQLLNRAPKHTQHPEMMSQLSLKLINYIPSQALVLYTDGSKSESGRTGSGVYSKAEDGLVFRCRFRNPDNCSVFRSELLPSEKP